MKRDIMDDILKKAAADAEAYTSEYIDRLDMSGETVSPELERRMAEMFGSHRKVRRMRALTSAVAGIVAVVCVWVSAAGVLPEKYLIGDVAEPTWFPADVKKTVITDTERLFEAVYTAKDGRKFYFSQEKQTVSQDSEGVSDSLFSGEASGEGDDVTVSGDEAEFDGTQSEIWVEWRDGECKYSISGDAKEIELRRMAKSSMKE